MSERDPIEFLSHAIDRPEQPDAKFATDLLDQLLDELAEATPAAAVPLPSAARGDTADGEHVDAAPPVQILTPSVDQPRRGQQRYRRARVLSFAAAVALLVLGSLALLRQGADEDEPLEIASGEGSPTAVVEDSPAPPLITAVQQIAIDFLSARSAHDGPAMQALLADDVTIVNEYGIATVDDYLARAEFERLTNTDIFDIVCDPVPDSQSVSCLFSYRNDIGRHLRAEPYGAEVVAAVRGGRIVDLLAATDGIDFESDIEYFLDWLGRTHPADLAAVAGEPTFAGSVEMQVTSATGAILAARTPEFAASTVPPIMKLLADDPRFTALAEGLARTRVGDGLSFCTTGSATLFAPTNAAFDRYIATSGLDRATVLGDAGLFETFIVDDVVTMERTDGLAEQALQVETQAGETITVVTGADASVQGTPVLPDAIDIAACNGAIQGIDEIYTFTD